MSLNNNNEGEHFIIPENIVTSLLAEEFSCPICLEVLKFTTVS